MKICRFMLSFILAIAMTVTMMPWMGGSADKVYAETATAQGGPVASNSESSAEAAFGSGNATAARDGNVMTITLNNDITLQAPIQFTMGAAGDKIILDLNGHSLKGANGENDTNIDVARGKNAIEIKAAAFDVEITDRSTGSNRGSITGGDGAVFEDSEHFMSGRDGGAAICFVNDEDEAVWSPNGGKLEYGLTISGNVKLNGGNGGSVTSEHWLSNIANFTGGRNSTSTTLALEAGCGGAGIAQSTNGKTLVYTKIIVENGTVTGGKGGDIDISNITPTFYALMTSDAVAAAMGDLSNDAFRDRVLTMKTFRIGAGGDGIQIGYGRKYVCIEDGSTIKGNACGSIIYGSGRYINSYDHTINALTKGVSRGDDGFFDRIGAAGDGIAVRGGDIGLTNTETVGYSGDEWQNKGKNSDDMGLYIAGSVIGGNASDAVGLNEEPCDGGAGVALYGDINTKGYNIPNGESLSQWGIVCVDNGGSVKGGNGGSSMASSGSLGGYGIYEHFERDNQEVGTDYFIINGTITGGNGGDSRSANFGNGGHGIGIMDHYRENLHIAGQGVVAAGDAGETVDREGISTDGSQAEAIYNISTRTNYMTVNTQNGKGATSLPVNEINVTVSMSSFSGYPTSESPEISCTFEKPNGYTGGAYIQWFVKLKLQSNPSETFVLEPSGNTAERIHFLDNEAYKYVEYDNGHYHLNVGTIERIKDVIRYNNSTASVQCKVLLEDGSWGKSEPITFTKDGYNGGGSGEDPGGPTQEEIDQAAADSVYDMLFDLPGLGSLTLEDADAVAAVRAAYEALTPSQQARLELFNFLQDLEAAEARIAQLQGAADAAAAENVETLITALADPELITLEDEEAIIAAREAYDNLTDAQKALVSQDALDKLEAAEAVIGQLNQAAADVVISKISQIVDLSTLNPEDPDYETKLQAAKTAIEQASQAYSELSPTQKELIDTADKEKLRDAVEQYNEMFPDNPIDDPTVIEITADMITVADETYTGKALTPKVTVKDGNRILTEGDDYEKQYSNNTNAGKGKVTVSGKGDYTGEASKEFTINPKKITPAVSLSAAKYTWNGKVIKPAVTVKNGNVKLAASQYTVTYAAGGKDVGTYNVTVKLKGNYSGTRTASFTIVPKGATIVKPKPAKKALTVKWKKQSAKMSKSRITGYQIQCSTSKAFKSGVKKKTVKGFKKTSVKVSKLKGKKKYYVRVRTYLKTGGKTYYSEWSRVKPVKTK